MSDPTWDGDWESEALRLRAALVELVSCKDLRDTIEGHMARLAYRPADAIPLWLEDMRADYARRKPAAWSAAREAIAGCSVSSSAGPSK